MKHKSYFYIFRVLLFLFVLELFFYIGAQASNVYTHFRHQIKHRLSQDVTVLCLGESITQSGGDASYPNLLEKYLNAHSKKHFNVINLAQAGQGSDFVVARIKDWLVQYEPDFVVTMMGLFDAGLKTQADQAHWSDQIRSWQVIKVVFQKEIVALIKKWQSLLTPTETEPKEIVHKKPSKLNFQQVLKAQSQKFQKLYVYAMILKSRKQYAEQEKILKILLSVQNLPQIMESKLYYHLGENLWQQQKHLAYIKVMTRIPYYSWPDDWVEKICIDGQRRELFAAQMLRRIKGNDEAEAHYDLLSACYMYVNDTEAIQNLADQRQALGVSPVFLKTKNNYLRLLDILQTANVRPVLSQYPLKDVKLLQGMVKASDQYDQIIFVDNQVRFETALTKYAYSDLFKDRAAAKFGHGTAKGNQILAENVGDAILKHLP